MIIVSGLERSGTSLMMQILEDAGYDLAYDDSREPDDHNPNGYYELSDGKIIIELMDGEFNPSKYNNKVVKITAFGLPMLEKKDYYKVIYMERNIDEVIESQNKMIGARTYHPHSELVRITKILNEETKDFLNKNDIPYVIINYNNLMKDPDNELVKLSTFLNKNINSSMTVIDKKLYRNRRK